MVARFKVPERRIAVFVGITNNSQVYSNLSGQLAGFDHFREQDIR